MQSSTATESLSITQTINGCHNFPVKGFSLTRGIGIGVPITSEAFTAGGHQWRVYFYPEGKRAVEDATIVSVYISLDSDAADVRALFELTLVDQSGKGRHKVDGHFNLTRPNGPHILSSRKKMWGYRQYFIRTDLEASDYLKDDCLKFHCTVGVVVTKIDPPQVESIDVPESDINSQFGMLLEDEMCSDITFNVSGKTFRAHSLVFAARSPVFTHKYLDVPREEDNEIEITDMEPLIFKALLHFIYTDSLIEDIELSLTSSSEQLSVSQSVPAKLLCVACKYKMPRLSLMCESVLCKKLTVDSLSELLVLADQYNAQELKLVCEKFARFNLFAFVNSDGFESLREHSSSLHHELKTVAGFEVEVNTRSVWKPLDAERCVKKADIGRESGD